MTEDNLTDDEIQEWGEELISQLHEMENAIYQLIPKVEAVLDGEITYEEYREWVENNAETLEALEV
jgi:hypothetical protein